MQKTTVFILLLCLNSTNAYAEICTAIHVAEDDTIKALCNDKQVIFKLYGIDTPEQRQPFGREARDYAKQFILNKEIDVKRYGTDRYGYDLVVVTQNSLNLNQMLIQNGLAWVYNLECTASFCEGFKEFEQRARQQHIGLWADPQPIAPWVYKIIPIHRSPAGSQIKENR